MLDMSAVVTFSPGRQNHSKWFGTGAQNYGTPKLAANALLKGNTAGAISCVAFSAQTASVSPQAETEYRRGKIQDSRFGDAEKRAASC